MKSLIAILLLLTPTTALAQEPIVGRATVIDGDTLEVRGVRIRLFGIDAPESDQTCLDEDGKTYRCGQKAAIALADFIGARTVTCTPHNTDRYGRTVETCSVGGEEVGGWLVRLGLALDYPQYSKGRYAAAQKQAERAGDGMWGGQWVVPWAYRACRRDGGLPAQCSAGAALR
jgi:endonuclease YncB( thermonuclease family)